MTDFSSQPQRPRRASHERQERGGRHERPRASQQAAGHRAAERAGAARPARSHARAAGDTARPASRVRARMSEQGRAHASGPVAARTRDRSAAKASPAQAVFGWCSSHLMLCIVVGVIVAVLVALYPPAKALYGARRTNAVLAQRLDAATSSAQTLQSEVDSLMTREGIEDEARRRGYVQEGDTAVDMDGVTDSGSATTDESVTNDSSTTTDEQPTPWYTSALDFIFGYDPSTQGVG